MTTAAPVRVDPEILGGTPVFPGTRVPVETLFPYLRKGHRIEDFGSISPASPSSSRNPSGGMPSVRSVSAGL